MKTSSLKQSMLAAALATGVLALGTAEARHTQEVLRFKGLSAWGSFSSSDECSSTYAFISVFEEVSHSAGNPPSTGTGVSASYSSYNWCTGESSYSWGFTNDALVTGNISAVSVDATVPLFDYYTGATRTMEVDLTFNANQDVSSHGVSNYTFTSPFERSHFRWNGRTRSANVTGSLRLDGMELLDTLTAQDAYISVSNSGSVTIYRF